MTGLETHYSVSGIEARILAAIREAGLDPERRLSPEELGALARRSLEEDQVRLVRGVFRAKWRTGPPRGNLPSTTFT